MMADTVLVTELYPQIERAFSVKTTVSKFEKIIGDFIDRNTEILSAIGPIKMLYFSERDKNVVYDIVGVTPDYVKKIQNKSKDIRKTGRNMANPFNALMVMIVRYFTLQKNDRYVRLAMTYLSLSMYPSLFHKYFKYETNENIMNYTVNNMSNKYKLKQSANLLTAIDETGFGGYSLHKDSLIKGTDIAVTDIVLAVKTRLNSFMKKIAREYYKNHQDGKYLNVEFETNDEDKFREADSSSYAIARIVDKVALRLVIDGAPIKLINMSAKTNNVSVSELRNYINTLMIDNNIGEIKELIESILFLYLFDEQNTIDDITDNKFLLYCLDVYRRSNTSDKNVIKVKSILDVWLERLGTYKKTQRLATINNFRRALYTFIVMAIMYYGNN